MMKTTINIKNFRVFDENGATFELNPITILTGSNSSGKSSINKAIMLLKTYIDHIREDIRKGNKPNLSAYKLDFASTAGTLKLGSFHQALHRGSQNELITFEITTYSRLLGEDIVVTLAFGPDKNDIMDNGYLRIIEFKKMDGTLLYNCKCPQNQRSVSTADFDGLKDGFFRFLNTIINWSLASYQNNMIDNKQKYLDFAEAWGFDIDSDNVVSMGSLFEEKRKKYVDIIRDYDNMYKNNLKDFCFSNSEPHIELYETNPFYEIIKERLKGELSLIENAFKMGTLFYIPILEDVWCMDKTKVRSYLTPFIEDKSHNIAVFNEIMDDFEESDFNYFGEYFKEKEYEYINRVYSGSKSSVFLSSDIDPLDLKSNFEYSWRSDKELKEFVEEGRKVLHIDKNEQINTQVKRLRRLRCNIIWILRILNNANISSAKIGQEYKCYGLFQKYIKWAFNDIISTIVSGQFDYYTSDSSEIKRIYTMESDDEFSSTLLEYAECVRQFRNIKKKQLVDSVVTDQYETRMRLKESKFTPGRFINKWLKALGIADKIKIEYKAGGLGLTISTRKANENKSLLLADQGVGITQLVALLLRIESNIMNKLIYHYENWLLEDKKYKIHKDRLLIIEEPEIHLHPKYQSLLADMFLEAYEKYNIHFIVETHSEYLIRKTQVLVAEANYADDKELKEKNPFMVYFMPDNGKPYEMVYRTDGCFENDFGNGFFDEAEKLAFRIL
ncbi:MAG: AAA family ATPase [Muribaculaceae bacterium]|nr:AAA family ATPase [Muribaculaceae bacterium]